MKKLHIFVGIFILFILPGCSGDPENQEISSPEKSMLSFGAILNTAASEREALKQEIDLQECSNDSPAFLEIVISRNDIPVVGTFEEPARLVIDPNAVDLNGDGLKEYLSQKAASLELDPGNYTLEYFVVLNAAEEIIWFAPVFDDNESSNPTTNKPLPYHFSLAPGINKFLDLEVICFNEGIVFDVETSEVLEFCIFGNFCNEDGRHAEAMRIIANVWEFSGDEEEPRGALLYENATNEILISDNFEEGISETSAEPLCLSLPDGSGEDEYYLEITLGSGIGYSEEERVIRRGVITEEDIRSLFDGVDRMDYYHIREGNCNLADSPELLDIVDTE